MSAPKPNPPDWPRLQNFKVLKVLGKGSYGKVYKVERTTDSQCYAIKEVEMAALDQQQRNDSVNEIRLLCSINHPNVTRYHEAFVNGTKLYVVMEYAPYGELKYYIEKAQRMSTPFPEECVWRLFLQLAKGLAALHAQQIIHRDIKPANIFLCANDMLKIGDLGIAKALTQLQFTRTQIGTPLYMAPEVWSQRPYSYGSDMWSLGCLLYEMMTLQPPFRARTAQELQARIQTAKYDPIPAGAYSPELIGFASALLDVDPRKRPTAEQILSSAPAAKWLRVVPAPRRPSENGLGPVRAPSEDGSAQLLSTILVPRDLRNLPKVLPPPSYDSDGGAPPNIPKPPSAAKPGNVAVPAPPGAMPPKVPSPKVPSPSAVAAAPAPAAGRAAVPSSVPARPPSLNGAAPLRSPSPVPSPAVGYVPSAGARRMSENGGAVPGARVAVPGRRMSDNGGALNPPAGRLSQDPPALVLPPIGAGRVSGDGGRVSNGGGAPAAGRPSAGGRRMSEGQVAIKA